MKRTLLTLLLAGGIGCSFAQDESPAELDPITRFSQTITEDDYRSHVYFLADDLLEGRETGERGMDLAALYIRTRFMGFGLKPLMSGDSYYQPYSLTKSEILSANLTIGKKKFSYGEDFLFMGGDVRSAFSGDYVFVGYGSTSESYNNLENLQLAGKIAVMMPGNPDNPSEGIRSKMMSAYSRAEALKSAGAKGVMIMLEDQLFKIMGRFASPQFLSVGDDEEPSSNMLFLSEETSATILKAGGFDMESMQARLKERADVSNLTFKKSTMAFEPNFDSERKVVNNVLGFLEGTDLKDEVLVITGHFDHIGINKNGEINNGADDDASGTSTVLELAQAFSIAAENGYRPRRSILFMTVSGEEKGLLGSGYYTDHPVIPLENTVANLNIDMIGRTDTQIKGTAKEGNYVFLIGSDKLSTDLHNISEAANEQYTGLDLDYKYNDENDPNRYYYRSDHYNFAKNNIPVIFYFTGTHEDYHKPTDDAHKIQYDQCVKIARLVFATAWELANRDQRIIVDKASQN
ncbi:M28 family peptidase [Pontibacter sp. G13]|uniref:M28 family peptidase n=1 Tax=Pontibacter sp. G13 TaxID=3074898 RepID=UPI00288A9D85|nr:M28 family peptidase [Pontibacter sp. G13]WNJ18017.1 M28 family peptidase [Pontibacter sp. G13]